ncbi:MAG: IS1182 family transposase [Planctomycetota bacterium]
MKVSKNKRQYQPAPLLETDPRFEDRLAAALNDKDAQQINRLVDSMDHSALHESYKGVGSSAYDPVAMLKMMLYCILSGKRSPTACCKEAKINLVMQWLGGGITPSKSTWFNFRNRMSPLIESLVLQLVQRAVNDGLVKATTGVQDGSSIAACASRHRMVTEATLTRKIATLSRIVEGQHPSSEPVPKWCPRTTDGMRRTLECLHVAHEELKVRIAKNNAKKSGKRKDSAKIQISTSDPVAAFGPDKMRVFRPLYTLQLLTDADTGMILGFSCRPEATDAGTLLPMCDQIRRTLGNRMKTVLADAGYCSIMDLVGCRDRGIELLAPPQSNSFTKKKLAARPNPQIPREQFQYDAVKNHYVCPQGKVLKYEGREQKSRRGDEELTQYRFGCDQVHCGHCPLAQHCLGPGAKRRTIRRNDNQEILDAQKEKMNDPETLKRYAQRGKSVELAFADAKSHRNFHRFHGRGLAVAHAECGLMVLAHTIQCLDRLQRAAENSAKTPV